jgi:hypothetical protein
LGAWPCSAPFLLRATWGRSDPTGFASGGFSEQAVWRGALLYDFLWEALELITFWVVVIGCLKLLERVLVPYLRHREQLQRKHEESLSASLEHRNHLEELTRAALTAKRNTLSEEILTTIRLLAKSKRVNTHELERMVTEQFGVGLNDLDEEDAQSVINQLEAISVR